MPLAYLLNLRMLRHLTKRIDLDTGVTVEEIYWQNHKKHREPSEGPAVVKRNAETGAVRLEEYWLDGQLHRENGPATIMWTPEGTLSAEQYFWHGIQHREPGEGPALVTYYSTSARGEIYMRHGKKHRDPKDGPAVISHNPETGAISRQEYWYEGKKVRAPRRGPAPVRRRDYRPMAVAVGIFCAGANFFALSSL